MAEDLIVVVPGITGSALRSADGDLWDLSVAAVARGILHTADVLARMRLPEGIGDAAPEPRHALQATGLIPGVHLWPGFWLGAGYGRLERVVRRLGPSRVLTFPYDWRLSNRHTARRLRHDVARALERWRRRPGQSDAMVILVCHSMGGLLARYYLDVLDGAETTRRLITVGTPYSGSVKAVKALAGGLVPRLARLDEALVDVARTFPAVHQLLPTYHCINVAGDDPVTLAEHDLPDVPTAAVADAHAFHDELRNARGGTPAYEEHFFGGKDQPTDQSITLTHHGLAFERTQRGTDHRGDGTVPYFSSIPTHATSTAAAVYWAERHAKLPVRRQLLDLLTDKIEAVDHGAVLAPAHDLSLDLPEVVVAGDEVPITVTAEAHDLFLHATVTGTDGTVHDHHIPVEPHGDGTYTGIVRAPAGTWHVDVETVDQATPAQVGDILIAVDRQI